MPVKPIADIKNSLLAREFPTVMMWNRLEGRPRTHHFNRALKAEVRDALWMLSRQWQMGEFKAEDAGSPIFAKLHISTTKLNRYQAAGNVPQPYERNIPLEVKAEQKKIPFTRAGKEITIDIRLQMGRYWLRLLEKNSLDFNALYISNYTFSLPAINRNTDYIFAHKETWQQYAAISGRCMDGYKLYQHITTGPGKAADGISNTDPAMTKLNDLGLDFKSWFEHFYYQPLDEKNNAWIPERLEYQFECTATSNQAEKTLFAEEYYQGQPDWYVFDIRENAHDGEAQAPLTFTHTLIPSHVQFDGMPNTRWWKFEDGKTNFGDVQPSTTDLSKLLLMEFGLVFANDWFLVPFSLPVGSLANIEGLTVKNNFGETTWINAAEQSGTGNNSWSMFKLHSSKPNNTLFLPPAAIKVQDGQPLEEIVLIRDEISNMVWGIETIVPSPLGIGERGNEAGLRTRQFHDRIVLREWLSREVLFYTGLIAAMPNLAIGPIVNKSELEQVIFNLIKNLPDRDPLIMQLSTELGKFNSRFTDISTALGRIDNKPDDLKQQLNNTRKEFYTAIESVLAQRFEKETDPTSFEIAKRFLQLRKNKDFAARIHYHAMTDVPENWIPFIPVHITNDNRETQLQRASMLRIVDGDTANPVKIKPQTSILREGLDSIPDPKTYIIHEQEVLRAGTKVEQSFQRTRWINGEVLVWLGMKKKTGRGEGSSGLAFDQIKDAK